MRQLLERKIGLFPGQKGFTFLEVLIALFILGALGAALLTALQTNDRATRTLDEKVVATNLATAYFEAIQVLPYADNYTSAGDNITIPPQYSVAIKIQYSINGTDWVDAYSGQTLQKITIIISREGRPVLSVCTFKTAR